MSDKSQFSPTFNHALLDQARIAGNIQRMYSNTETLTGKVMGVEEFQKSYPAEKFNIFTEKQVKEYSKKVLDDSNKIEKSERPDIFSKATNEIKSLELVTVVGKNTKANFYVKAIEVAAE